MICGNYLDDTIMQCLPEGGVVRRRLQGRIHLDKCAESCVVLGIEEQMMRTDFGGYVRSMIGDQRHFCTGRYMQDVESMAMAGRQIDRATSGHHRRLHVTYA